MKLIGTGLEAGTWGLSTNENLKRIDQTLSGTSDNFDVTLPPGESSWLTPTVTWLLQDTTDAWDPGSDGRNRYINFTGSPGVNVTVNIRGNSSGDVNNNRIYWVRNSVTAGAAPGYTITFNGGAGDTFVLANGATALIYSDSSGDVRRILDSLQVSGLDFTQEATGAAAIKLPNNKASALLFEDTTTGYDFVKFTTSTGNQKLILGDVNIPNLEINSPTVDFNSTELNLATQVVDIKLKGADSSGEARALDFVSNSDERILTLDTNTTRVEIPSGSTLDIATGATILCSASSTVTVSSSLTASAGVVISGGPGTIDNQVIGGSTALAGTFSTSEAPVVNVSGATGYLNFNSLLTDDSAVGFKLDSGVLKVKTKAAGSFGGFYASNQVSGDGTYIELTLASSLPADDAIFDEPHLFGSIPRLYAFYFKIKSGETDQGYSGDPTGDEIAINSLLDNAFTFLSADGVLLTPFVNATNAGVAWALNGTGGAARDTPDIVNRSTAVKGQMDRAKWEIRVRLWK